MYIIINLLKKLAVFATLVVVLYLFISSNVIFGLVLVMAALYITGPVFNIVWYLLPKEMLSDLSAKAVFVTGCDSGFGHALVQNLDKLGVTVFAGCLFPDGEGASRLKKSCSERLKVVQLDITKDDQVTKALEIVTSTLANRNEKLWAVVNNAGVGSYSESAWTPVEEFQRLIDVNTIGQVRVTHAFLPLLRESKGRVVNVTSFLGRVTFPGLAAYSMSKYAAVSLSDALRRELMKWSVSVHTVQPWIYSTGLLNPDIFADFTKEMWEKAAKSIQEGYGRGYFKRFQTLGSDFTCVGRPMSAVYEVVDSMTHAAVGKNPKVCYIPGLIGLISNTVLTYICDEILDIGSYIVTRTTCVKEE